MFLKEFAIRRYGPLPDSGRKILAGFNFFYGPNEEGKTLTIDALLKMLFSGGKGLRGIKGIKRVDESPDGYLVFEDEEGEEIKLPEAGSLSDRFGLSAVEFRNIFLIRDSDLSIDAEGDFYRGITQRLTGMRSEEIRKIKDELRRLGKVTEGGDFQNTAPEKIKDRYKQAQDLLGRAETLFSELQEEGFGQFEEDLALLERRRIEIINLVNLYRAAAGRKSYQTGREALDKLQQAEAELKDLEQYSRDEYDSWQRAEASLEHLKSDLGRLEKEAAEQKINLMAAREEHKKRMRAYKKTEQSFIRSGETVKPLLNEFDQRDSQLREQEILINSVFFKRASLLVPLAMLMTLAGAILRPQTWWLLVLFSASLLITAYLGWQYSGYIRKKSGLAAIEAGLCAAAEKAGLTADGISSIRADLGRLENELTLEDEFVQNAEKELEWQVKEEARLKRELEQTRRRISETEEQINSIKLSAVLENLDQYAAILKKKRDLSGEIDKQKSILESHFGRGDYFAQDEQLIVYWEKQVKSLEQYAGAAVDIDYDQEKLTEFTAQLEELETEIEKLENKLSERSGELHDLEKEFNDLIKPEDGSRLPCQTTVDLEVAARHLRRWIEAKERAKDAASIALDIFDQIAAEEEQKVTALFGKNSPVSAHYARITGGRYKEVAFESSENVIKVFRDDGKELRADQLSGGAFDQLYFSIRLALGEKLLEGNKGFFILDDPFIKADPGRLAVLFEMLAEISGAGWQILYFSAKGEVKELLQERANKGEVKEFIIT